MVSDPAHTTILSLFMSGFRVGILLFVSGFHFSCRDFIFHVGTLLFVSGFRTSIFALLGFHRESVCTVTCGVTSCGGPLCIKVGQAGCTGPPLAEGL